MLIFNTQVPASSAPGNTSNYVRSVDPTPRQMQDSLKLLQNLKQKLGNNWNVSEHYHSGQRDKIQGISFVVKYGKAPVILNDAQIKLVLQAMKDLVKISRGNANIQLFHLEKQFRSEKDIENKLGNLRGFWAYQTDQELLQVSDIAFRDPPSK